MDSLQVPVDPQMRVFLESRAAAQGHASAGDYVCSLIRAAQQAHELEQLLVARLDEIDGGDCREMTTDDWQQMRAGLSKRSRPDRS